MASKIILKKSSVAAKAPVAGDLEFGELAINYTDSKLYFKKADGSIDAFTSAAASAPVTSVGGNIGAVTDAQLLASIKNVDGTGSGLDADFLDGLNASAFYLASNPNGYTSNTGTVTSVGATAPLVSSGGNTPSLSIPAANSTTNGFMSSAYASKLDGIAAGATNVTNNNQLINGAGYTTNTGTVTSVSGTGSVSGLSLSGTVTTSGSLTLSGTLSASIDNITDEARLFNNMGQNHSTQTDFNAISDFGARFVQGGTNGPTGVGTNQFYGFTLGLGNDYGLASYASQLYWPRAAQNTDTYIYVRDREGGTWGSWRKTKAGYADSAGSASSVSSTTSTGIQSSFVTTINTTTPGLTTYGLAFSGSSAADNAQGITWGWSGTSAQAGIYVQSSGAYGTKMYLATTDSFATGAKTAITIDHNGHVSLNRGTFSNGSVWINNGANSNGYNENIRLFNAPNGVSVIAFSASGISGTPTTSILGYSDRMERRFSDGWQDRMYNGYVEAAGSYRAPIFYDSNNTGYYVDPTSLSSLRTVGSWRSDSSAWDGEFSGKIQYHSNNWYFQAAGEFIWRNSGGSNVIYGDQSGNHWATASSRSPIFYDNNDTGYYIDPNSTSDSALRMRGGALFGPNTTWGASLYVGGNGRVGTSASVAVTNGNLHIDSQNGYELYLNWYNTANIYTQSNLGVGSSSASYRLHVHGTGYAASDFRAPIFYDANDTAYYSDQNSTSSYYRINVNNNILFTNFGRGIIGTYASTRYQAVFAMGDSYKLPDDGTTTGSLYGLAWSHPNAGGTAGNLNTHGLLVLENGGFLAAVSGSIRSRDDMRSPIFYDSNNTGYYNDPASVSYLYGLTLAGGSYFRPQNWIQLDGSYGLYWPNHYGAHLHANDLSTYTQIALRGSKNSYSGIYDQYSAVNGFMYDGGGNGGVYREANGRWYFYYHLSNDCMSIGTSTTSSSYGVYCNKGAYYGSRVDGTIFYDSNNTAYYVDPNGDSRLNGRLTVNGGHGDSSLRVALNAAENGAATGEVALQMWCSEPGITWDWAGFGYNVDNNNGSPSGFGRPNTSFGQAYMRMGTGGQWYFYTTNTSGTRYTNMYLAPDNGVETFGILRNDSSVRSPIYYDSNDTGYYLDPNDTSRLNYLRPNRISIVGNQDNGYPRWDFKAYVVESQHWYAHNSSMDMYMGEGNAVWTYNLRSNIYYDRDNTGYYADLNNTTYLYYLQSATTVRADSDRRLKENITPITSALSLVRQLQGCRYTRNDLADKTKVYIGMIAQDVLPIVPEVVSGSEAGKYSLGYAELVPVLNEAVKELDEIVSKQAAIIAKLEERLSKLLDD